MASVAQKLGKILRLIGISSPEDAAARKNAPPPSWKMQPKANDAEKRR